MVAPQVLHQLSPSLALQEKQMERKYNFLGEISAGGGGKGSLLQAFLPTGVLPHMVFCCVC